MRPKKGEIIMDCEFWTYESFEYSKDDTDREYPIIAAPYHIGYSDKYNVANGTRKCGIELCKLTMCHKRCDEINKYCCDRYKKHLDYKKRPKLPTIWNKETKQMEYGINIDWDNWNI